MANTNFVVHNGLTVGTCDIYAGNGAVATSGNITTSASLNGTASTAKYADLAEKYLADAAYSAGTVVCFGGEQEITLCTVDMCKSVAGVVSTNPAYLMNGRLESTHLVAVALVAVVVVVLLVVLVFVVVVVLLVVLVFVVIQLVLLVQPKGPISNDVGLFALGRGTIQSPKGE